ncbi:MAG: hypothetical protein HUJ61_06795 [Bacilli bacterium]|nr:hypothetical protein [Bacilli bacterium]
MKVKKIILALIMACSLTSCNQQNSCQLSFWKPNDYSSFINDDENENMPNSINYLQFDDFSTLRSFISKKENTNYTYYNLLIPTNINSLMNSSFVITDNDKRDNNLINAVTHEIFYVYDEVLGSISDTNLDIPYYSMKIHYISYPINKDDCIFVGEMSLISASKIKITFKSIDKIIGYAYVSFGNLNCLNYIENYFCKNIIKK